MSFFSLDYLEKIFLVGWSGANWFFSFALYGVDMQASLISLALALPSTLLLWHLLKDHKKRERDF